jgi:hypothetical protein
MRSSTLMTRPFANLISTAPLRRLEVGAAALLGWAGASSDGGGTDLVRASLSSDTMRTDANATDAPGGLSDSSGIRPSRT